MKKIISAGHICLDITPVFPAKTCCPIGQLLEPGKLVHMEGVDIHTGGSVANTGLALKKLGADVSLLGKIGADAFGTLIQEVFREHGAEGLIVDPTCATSYSVVLAAPGTDRIFLHDPGANDCFSSGDIPQEVLDQGALLHFGYPTLMGQMYRQGGKELADIFRRAKARGVATSLDLAAVDPNAPAGRADWQEILRNVLPDTDFFVPSFEELCFMLDRPKYDRLVARGGDISAGITMEEDVVPLAEKCIAMGCRVVLIKCGTSGMYYRTAGREAMDTVGKRLELEPAVWADAQGVQPCYQADRVLSGTGAGDTSIAAFLLAVTQGKGPAACAALAAAEGACCVTAYDALSGLKTLPELEARIASGWKTR